MTIRPNLPPRSQEFGSALATEHVGHGGLLATIVSGIALVFSALSYYETSLKTANLAVYVPPMIHYARDGDSDVFNVPITIANDGAQSGTVLNMELHVENLRAEAERKTARFHSAFLGEYPRDDKIISRSFAPLSIPGHGTFTETVRFYPMDAPLPFLVDEKGDYRFKLILQTAKPADPGFIESALRTDPEPLTFELNLPYMAFQHLAFRNGTLAMFNKSWKPAVSSSTPSSANGKPREAPPANPPVPQTEPTPDETPVPPVEVPPAVEPDPATPPQ